VYRHSMRRGPEARQTLRTLVGLDQSPAVSGRISGTNAKTSRQTRSP
ncbi:MAG: hypothetical protein QOK19_369, partial [Solirubrobacteraceae bacterium]|nr:hypothetical protein [Solirubrobacteraceae bacterium]